MRAGLLEQWAGDHKAKKSNLLLFIKKGLLIARRILLFEFVFVCVCICVFYACVHICVFVPICVHVCIVCTYMCRPGANVRCLPWSFFFKKINNASH